MTEERRDSSGVGDPEAISRTRSRAVGVLALLFAVVVVAAFAWYALVTVPRFGLSAQPATPVSQQVLEEDTELSLSDPVQGS